MKNPNAPSVPALHPIWWLFALGLLAPTVLLDLAHFVTASPVMGLAAYWMIVIGLLGGSAASLFGWLDWWALPRGVGRGSWLFHLGSLAVLALFSASLQARHTPELPTAWALLLSASGAGLALLTAWFDNTTTERWQDKAHWDAQEALRQRHPTEAGRKPAPHHA